MWRVPSRWLTTCALLAPLCALFITVGPAYANPVYNTGPLNFSTTGQSMWGSGGAFMSQNSVFVGTQWQNQSHTYGDITGSYVPATYGPTNPLWYAWQGCESVTPGDPLCGSEPSQDWGQITPATDTRTGATVSVSSSGRLGLDFGYSINSGSVNATAAFGAQATLPQTAVAPQQYFSLQTASSLNGGSINTQSPNAQAYVNAVAQLSGTISAEGCLIGAGCITSPTDSLPTVNKTLPILSVDPNQLSILPGIQPDGSALFTTSLAAQGLGLEGALAPDGVPGFTLTGPPNGITYVSTEPPTPTVTANLASINFQLPNIATSGGLSGNTISSSGSDPFLTGLVDLSGVATLAGLPLNLGLSLLTAPGINIGASFSPINVQAGPQLSVGQNFSLQPELMTNLAFSNPVMIQGMSGPQTSWTGAWANLPQIALLGTTTFTPTFWLNAPLTNDTSINLGLIGTMDLYQFNLSAVIGGLDLLDTTISLNTLTGLSDQLFSTPTLDFPILNNTFALGGFNTINGTPFTITVGNAVPEPSSLSLFIAGISGLLLLLMWERRKPSSRASGKAA